MPECRASVRRLAESTAHAGVPPGKRCRFRATHRYTGHATRRAGFMASAAPTGRHLPPASCSNAATASGPVETLPSRPTHSTAASACVRSTPSEARSVCCQGVTTARIGTCRCAKFTEVVQKPQSPSKISTGVSTTSVCAVVMSSAASVSVGRVTRVRGRVGNGRLTALVARTVQT